MTTSPLPWRISDAHGLCIVDANTRIVADLTPRSDWLVIPTSETLRANAEHIVARANVAAYQSKEPVKTDTTLRIWKFDVDPFQTTVMSKGATILYVGSQGDDVCVWALCDPDAGYEPRNIVAYATGHSVPAEPGRYLGTAQMDDGLVFHLFDGDDV